MGIKLVVCEKTSQAGAYAAALGAKKHQDGFLEGDGCVFSPITQSSKNLQLIFLFLNDLTSRLPLEIAP